MAGPEVAGLPVPRAPERQVVASVNSRCVVQLCFAEWAGVLRTVLQNGGIIPSYVALDGRIGGAEGAWWKNAYGWGFSPVNPVTGSAHVAPP